jgi:hypothetical protein
MDQEQAKFEGWAIVEMMGHQREIGYVTTEAYGVAVLFRVDVPDMPVQEYVLRRPEYGRDGQGTERYLPVGSKVQREGSPARSRLVSPAAVYAINPCSEEAARVAITSRTPRPLICIELPKRELLTGERAAPAESLEPGPLCQTYGQPLDEWHADDCPEADNDF